MGDPSEKEPRLKSVCLTIIMPVVITAMAGIIGNFIVSRYQEKITATTIVSQREQAESNLRANMFNTLISTIIASDGRDKVMTTEHEVVLLEMLTLNFSENFEFKPLLLHLDETLQAKLAAASREEKASIENERDHLVTASRKVVARQIAMINNGNKGEETTVVNRLIFTGPTDNAAYLGKLHRSDNARLAFTRFSSASDEVLSLGIDTEICLTSPDGNDLLLVDIRKPIWEEGRFLVHLVANDISNHNAGKSATQQSQSSCRAIAVKPVAAPRYPPLDMTFDVTPFDFPLTDNTLLASGNRFAVTIESSRYRKGNSSRGQLPSNVVLNVIWFPKSYFSPRERPINFAEFRKKLGITVR